MAKLDHILKQNMSRKDFLLNLGYGLLSLIGVTAFLNALGGRSKAGDSLGDTTSGFGAGAYGGGQNKPQKDAFNKY